MTSSKIFRTAVVRSLCVLAAALSVLSCNESISDDGESVSVEGLDDVTTFRSSSAEAKSFVISSTSSWTISIDDLDWLSLSRLKGRSGRYEVTMTAQDNPREERSGTLTFSCGEYSRTVAVVQQAGEWTPDLTLGTEYHRFEAISPEPFTFTVDANADWTIEAADMEWLAVSPMSGKRDRRTTVTLTAQDNIGRNDRSGSLILHSEGMADKTVSIVQDKLSSTLVVNGADDGRLAFSPVGETIGISIIANVPWSVSAIGADWLNVSPSGGEGDNLLTPKTISLTAESNPGPPRTGTLTISSTDGDVEPVVINVSQQSGAKDVLLAQWTMTAEHVKSISVNKKGETFTNPVKADLPAETEASMTWYPVNGKSTSYMIRGNKWASKLSASGQVEGHYLVKPVWTGDYMEFVIPGVSFPAGSKVTMRIGLNAQGGPILYYVKYLDGGEWKTTGTKTYTPEDPAYSPVETTIVIPLQQQKIHSFEETAVFSNGMENGDVRFRIECADGRFQADKTTGAATICSSLNSGAILRLGGWDFDKNAGNVGITFVLNY